MKQHTPPKNANTLQKSVVHSATTDNTRENQWLTELANLSITKLRQFVACRLWKDLHHRFGITDTVENFSLQVEVDSNKIPVSILAQMLANNNNGNAIDNGYKICQFLANDYKLQIAITPQLYMGPTAIHSSTWSDWQLAPLSVPTAADNEQKNQNDHKHIIIGSSEPYTYALYSEQIARITGKQPQLKLVEAHKLEQLLATLQSVGQHGYSSQDITLDISKASSLPQIDFSSEHDEQSIIQLGNWMLSKAIHQHASDIHLENKENGLQARARRDGILQDMLALSNQSAKLLINRIKLLANIDITEQRKPQDGRISVLFNNQRQEIRVAAIPTIHGEKLVLRFFDTELLNRSIHTLGFTTSQLHTWQELLRRKSGLLLTVGPTGSGKTSTLYASLHNIADNKINICTVEDPVEIVEPGFNQIQVNHQIGFDFSMALKHILRQDPDVIMIGEIRDSETAAIAVQAALTGHLVLASLHTTDSLGAVYRLLELGIPSYLLRSTLAGVISQRLIRLTCTQCAPPGQLNCPVCQGSGYSGRKGIFELLPTDEILIEHIENMPIQTLREKLAAKGFTTLRENAMELVDRGETTSQEVNRICPPGFEDQQPTT